MNYAPGLWKCVAVKEKDDTVNWKKWNVIGTLRSIAIHLTVTTGAILDHHNTTQDGLVHGHRDGQGQGRALILEIVD